MRNAPTHAMHDAPTHDSRRLGRFRIPKEHIETLPLARKILRDVVIVRAEMDFFTNSIEYIGIHYQFDYLPELQEVPWYDISVNKNNSGRTFTRRKDVPQHPSTQAVAETASSRVKHTIHDEVEEEAYPIRIKKVRGRPYQAAEAIDQQENRKRDVTQPPDYLMITRDCASRG